MLHIWKYLREVIVIVGICGEIKQRKTTSQIGIPIRIIQWRLNVEKTVFTLCLHTPSQYFDKLLSMRVCGYRDFVQVRPPAYLISEKKQQIPPDLLFSSVYVSVRDTLRLELLSEALVVFIKKFRNSFHNLLHNIHP